jgi:hypothetical protein
MHRLNNESPDPVSALRRSVVGAVVVASMCAVAIGCAGPESTPEGSTETTAEISAIEEADAVSAADLTAMDEEASGKERLQLGDFRPVGEADAGRIAEIIGDEANYMATANACFGHDVGLRFDLPSEVQVLATIGLDCWNVSFFPSEDDGVQIMPETAYLLPDKLDELALLVAGTLPELDLTDLGE